MIPPQRPGPDPHADDSGPRWSEERYRRLFDAIPQPVLVVEAAALSVLAANAAASRQYGYAAEEWSRLTLPDLRAADAPALADAAPAQATFTVAELHRRRDGSLFPVEVVIGAMDFDGRRVWVGVVTDVTERRRAEDVLRVSEARFRAVAESGSDAVLLVGRDGTILYRSPSATRILGYSPTERVGEVVMDLIHPDDRRPAREALARAVARPGEPVSVELRAVHEDRSLVLLECVLVSRLDDTAIKAVVVHYRDARRRAEP
jgi:PAS domain S-box-containing protein